MGFDFIGLGQKATTNHLHSNARISGKKGPKSRYMLNLYFTLLTNNNWKDRVLSRNSTARQNQRGLESQAKVQAQESSPDSNQAYSEDEGKQGGSVNEWCSKNPKGQIWTKIIGRPESLTMRQSELATRLEEKSEKQNQRWRQGQHWNGQPDVQPMSSSGVPNKLTQVEKNLFLLPHISLLCGSNVKCKVGKDMLFLGDNHPANTTKLSPENLRK